MQRVALLAPSESMRDLLVHVADEGTVDFDERQPGSARPPSTPAAALLQRLSPNGAEPALSPGPPDLERCQRDGRLDLLAGEAELEGMAALAVTKGRVTGLAGWMAGEDVARLAERVAPLGAAVVPMPRPAGAEPPTLLPRAGPGRQFAPLVQTYGTVPYADVDPSLLAGMAYVLMFGIMFADVGHGVVLVLAAAAVRSGRWPFLTRLRRVWVFLAGAGAASMVFGLLYGEFFGPTDVFPVAWLSPLDHPVPLLAAAVGVGALLLGGAYTLGTINRFREGGWRQAAYSPSGVAGTALFLGLAATAAAVYAGHPWWSLAGGVVALTGLSLAFAGMFASAGGGAAAAAQAAIELFDMAVRLLSNLVSFARLAAFGLTHAALGWIIWRATVGLAGHGPAGLVGAAAVFVAGNALTFGLEGLVVAIQALRLEYYELFSRVFDRTGRPYRPWHVPLKRAEVTC